MVPSLPPRAVRVRECAHAAGITPDILLLPEGAATAAHAAQALGIEVGQVANSLVFWCDGAPLLVMTSGAHRVDTSALAERLGVGPIVRARPEQVREATGQVIGGVAPTGHPARLRTVVDEDLAAYETVWAAAGTADTMMSLTFAELVLLTGGTVLPVA